MPYKPSNPPAPAVKRLPAPAWCCPGPSLPGRRAARGRSLSGFTLVEVLAALTFMAIVIPVAVEGLRIANLAGQVGQRKAVAARIAERILNEMVVTGQAGTAGVGGTIEEGPTEFEWRVRTENWTVDTMRLVTVQVTFPVQGKEYDVSLSTLVGTSM